MNFKSELVEGCIRELEHKRKEILNELQELYSAIANETKSSAGDKHETSRALMQNQREQTGNRLKETEAMIGALQQIDLQNVNTVIRSGSLVTTNKGNFIISIAYGRFDTGDKAFYFISPQSPLALTMTGKKRGDQFSFSNQEYQIVDVE
jgi:transcription elongation GreA/GreB family factor